MLLLCIQQEVAGIPINKNLLLEAMNCLNMKECHKFLILGLWDPEDYKFVGVYKPDRITDDEFIPITISVCLKIVSKYL